MALELSKAQVRVWSVPRTGTPARVAGTVQPRVSVCIPARNEAGTVGAIVSSIVSDLGGIGGVVHEVIVVDDSSTDDTAAVATAAGASVVRTADVLADQPSGSGKGNAMWAGVRVAMGDIVVFCDADLESFSPSYITRLIEPLLADPSVMLVKAFYHRPTDAQGEGGGRTTELMARPLLSLLFPVLATLRQPLSGEFALRRSVAMDVPFVQGYGVEAGLLIDVLQRYGPGALAQVDVGIKRHRHRSIADLAMQAREIASVILCRSGAALPGPPAHSERPPLTTL